MDLDEVTDQLYAGDLDEFMTQRTVLAKAARADGDKSLAATIAKLRKPSTSAWAINMFVRVSTKEVERLLDLGAAFRQAQDDLDGAELRDLSRQRQALVSAVVQQVRSVAEEHGRPLSESITTEVEQTLRAAMADEDAAAAVRGGALTTAISGSGLGSLKISDVAASVRPVLELVKPASKKARSKAGKAEDDKAAAEEAAAEAREAAARAAAEQVDAAERAASTAADKLTAAGAAAETARQQRDAARATLDDLREQVAKAEADLAAAEEAVTQTEQAEQAAKTTADDADRALFDALKEARKASRSS